MSDVRALALLALLATPAEAEPARIVAMSDGDSGKILLGGVEVKFRQMALSSGAYAG